MKKIFFCFLTLFLSLPLLAQTTNVSATVVDSDGTTWANGTWTITFRPNPDYPNITSYAQSNGSPLDPAVANQSGALDASGVLAVTVYDSSTVTPGGSGWSLNICPNANASCGTYIFNTVGASQSISSQLTQVIPAPRFKPASGSYGYNDSEAIIQLHKGATYWNVSLNTQRFYNGSAWLSGSGNANVAGSAGQVQFNCGNLCASGAILDAPGNFTTSGAILACITNGTISPNPTCTTYPADNTGVVDTAATLNSALAATGPNVQKTVTLGAGIYKVAGVLNVGARVRLRGQGPNTVLLQTSPTVNTSGTSVTSSGTSGTLIAGNVTYIRSGMILAISGITCVSGTMTSLTVTSSNPVTNPVSFNSSTSCTTPSGTGTITSVAPASAIVVTGDSPSVEEFVVRNQYTGARVALFDSACIYVNQATNYTIRNVQCVPDPFTVGAKGAASVGIIHVGTDGGNTSDVLITDTLADGDLYTAAAKNERSSNNTVIRSGDDCFSHNSYTSDTDVVSNIQHVNDVCIDGFNRGYDVDGGRGITFTGGSVRNVANAGILIHAGGNVLASGTAGNFTRNVIGTTVNGTLVIGGAANFPALSISATAYSSILGSVTSGAFAVNEIITQATSGATAVIANIPTGSNVLLMIKTNSITGTPDGTHIWTGGTSSATYTPSAAPVIASWSATGSLISGAFTLGENVQQDNTGAIAPAVNTPTGTTPLLLGLLFNGGAADSTSDWVGLASGARYTPTSGLSARSFTTTHTVALINAYGLSGTGAVIGGSNSLTVIDTKVSGTVMASPVQTTGPYQGAAIQGASDVDLHDFTSTGFSGSCINNGLYNAGTLTLSNDTCSQDGQRGGITSAMDWTNSGFGYFDITGLTVNDPFNKFTNAMNFGTSTIPPVVTRLSGVSGNLRTVTVGNAILEGAVQMPAVSATGNVNVRYTAGLDTFTGAGTTSDFYGTASTVFTTKNSGTAPADGTANLASPFLSYTALYGDNVNPNKLCIFNTHLGITANSITPTGTLVYAGTGCTSFKADFSALTQVILPGNISFTNTLGCLDGYDHLPCTVAAVENTTTTTITSTQLTTNLPVGSVIRVDSGVSLDVAGTGGTGTATATVGIGQNGNAVCGATSGTISLLGFQGLGASTACNFFKIVNAVNSITYAVTVTPNSTTGFTVGYHETVTRYK